MKGRRFRVGISLAKYRSHPQELGYPVRVLVNSLFASFIVPIRLRPLLLKAAGLRISLAAAVTPQVIFRSKNVVIGPGSTVNYRCIFDNRGSVTIGRRCGIGIGVTFTTSSHDMSDPDCRAGAGSLTPIIVGDGVWIGSGATILGGVSIGDGAVIAAGAVVTSNIPAHWLYGGIPAKPIRSLDPS
jgi:maltose O-acetyltransferase